MPLGSRHLPLREQRLDWLALAIFRRVEGPFLDIGDDTEIKPGMVFTVEPGLYAAGLGGFRHSDTVAVTDDGIEFLTHYPRDLPSLTLPV